MSAPQSLIEELECAIADSGIGQRADVLRRITDLFAVSSAGLSKQQVALFDDIMCRLLEEIESSARAKFGQRLATLEYAPPDIVRRLALDDSIDIAGPILRGYERIDETTLVESARTKGQSHLLAISGRRSLGEAVTDVLVERGDRQVAISAAANPGATFSHFGYSVLVKRSENDGDLALRVWSRPDIPRPHLLKLFAECSDTVRRKIQSGDRRNADLVRELVAQAADQLHDRARESSAKHAAARQRVHALHSAGQLSEARLHEFARAEKFDETTIALSLMCDLPIGVIERAMIHDGSEQIVVLLKAAGFSWSTAKAVLSIRTGSKTTLPHELEQSLANFNKLQPETAAKAMRFYRLRERAAKQAGR